MNWGLWILCSHDNLQNVEYMWRTNLYYQIIDEYTTYLDIRNTRAWIALGDITFIFNLTMLPKEQFYYSTAEQKQEKSLVNEMSSASTIYHHIERMIFDGVQVSSWWTSEVDEPWRWWTCEVDESRWWWCIWWAILLWWQQRWGRWRWRWWWWWRWRRILLTAGVPAWALPTFYRRIRKYWNGFCLLIMLHQRSISGAASDDHRRK